ncbi:MAG: hypothetical protein ACKPJO_31260 [Dolichospermum sp.]
MLTEQTFLEVKPKEKLPNNEELMNLVALETQMVVKILRITGIQLDQIADTYLINHYDI